MKENEPDNIAAAARHVYVHVPFCADKCAYCSFYSVPLREDSAERYLLALETEMDRVLHGARHRADTIYIGGGTPTMLGDDQLKFLVKLVGKSVKRSPRTEWTIEANPGTLTKKRLDILVSAGVNRISIGVQSLLEQVLRTLNRPHSVSDVEATCRLLREQGFVNFGIDIISGLPGVSRDAWHVTLSRSIGMAPRHISVYALSLDRGTRLATAVRHGAVTMPDEAAAQFALASATSALNGARFTRYEVSNFAQPGFECRHNLACWRGEDYLGFGPSAASRIGLIRSKNRADVRSYTAALSAGRRTPSTSETVDEETDCSERLAFAFRLTEGVELAAYAGASAATESRLKRWESALETCRSDGLVSRRGSLWAPTQRGLQFADTIAERLLPG
jgi:oxygen-independent coproporphyrinogen-3 oxidase